MRQKSRSLWAVFLCLVLCISLTPIAVFADEENPGETDIVQAGSEELDGEAVDAASVSKPANVTGLRAVPAGEKKVMLTWNPVSGAQGYLVYAQKEGKYGFVGVVTDDTTFTDAEALENEYNFYWVFAYVTDQTGKQIPGGCEKYVYAKGLAVDPPVTGLKVVSRQYNRIDLVWDEVPSADGYLIYGKTESGKYGYKGIALRNTWYDTRASLDEYNFYWVFAYHFDDSGKMITGQASPYVYGKPTPYVYYAETVKLNAISKEDGVFLTWRAAYGEVDGYRIYRKIGNGGFVYIGSTIFSSKTDISASPEEYNFYKVYPYIIDLQTGRIIEGKCDMYVYGKPTGVK